MVEIEDIQDRDTLRAWLKQVIEEKGEDEGRRIAVNIAHRAAMRTLPLFWRWVQISEHARKRDVTPLRALWAALISGVLGRTPPPEKREAATCIAAATAAYGTAFADDAAANEAFIAAVAAIENAYAYVYADPAFHAVGCAVGAACATNASAAASAASDANASAASAVANDPANATYAATADIDLWAEIRRDAASVLAPTKDAPPLWSDDNPLADVWADVKRTTMSSLDGHAHWSFWRRWYDDTLKGGPPRNPELSKAIALIDPEDWDIGAFHINDVKIPELQALYPDNTLETATPVEFSFDTLARVMRLIGVDDNLAHLKQPGVVQTFLDDAEEVREGLQDFADYAGDLSGGGNYAGVLRRAADIVLSELNRADEKMQIRAERIVMLAQDLESFSKEEQAVSALGPRLAEILDRRMSGLKGLCRTYFAPSYLSLAPLADVSLEQVDKDQVVELFDRALNQMRALPSEELVALDDEGMAVLEDMKREVADYRVAVAEASSGEFREMMEARMAQSAGGLALSFGRFLQRSSQAYGSVSKGTDETIKQYRRAKTLGDLMDVVEKIGSG